MLDSLRAFSRTWVAKIFLGVLVLSFALFGISNVIFDLGSSTVARVGDEEITAPAFQRAYQRQLNVMAQQFGQVPTAEQAVAFGIPGSVISQLAATAAVDSLADDMGLGVSQERLSILLRSDPSFSGTLGGFDRANFVRVLQQNGFTETEYFETQGKAAKRQQLASALFADSVVPDAAVELVSRFSDDTRTLDYFVVSSTSLPPVSDPTNAEMRAYLAEHQSEYRTRETRTVDVLFLTPDTLAAGEVISDADIAAEYERTRDSLIRSERRNIRQVVLPDDGTVSAFVAGKAAGRTFDDLIAETDLPVTDLGTLAQSEVSDPALAAAAFSLAGTGDFVVIPGIGGQRAVSVSAIEPGGEVSLADASADIRKRLALAAARSQYVDILDQVEELRAARQPLSEIATRFGLAVQTVSVSNAGQELASLPEILAEERTRVAQAVFNAELGEMSPPVVMGGTRNLFFDLKSVEPARDQTLDEVKDALVLAITEERTEAAVAAEVDRILQQLDAGTPFADVAMGSNQFPQLSQPITRNGDGSPVLTSQVAASAFAGGVGHYGAAQNEDGDYVVYQVVELAADPIEIDPQARTFVSDAARDTLYSDFVTGLRDQLGVRVNQGAIDQLLALDTATGQ